MFIGEHLHDVDRQFIQITLIFIAFINRENEENNKIQIPQTHRKIELKSKNWNPSKLRKTSGKNTQ